MQPASTKELNQLSKVCDELDFYIRAADGEMWSAAIRKDPKTFKRLVKLEATFERQMRAYFKDFAHNRVAKLVSWGQYSLELQKKITAADIKIDIDIDAIDQGEGQTLIKVILALYFDGLAIGTDAATKLYNVPVEYQSIIDVAEKQARKYGASLVSNINSTTATTIQSSIANSLALGETVDQATARLVGVIDSPVRAAMIARTESVNAYGDGINNFGRQTNAKGKVWSAVIDDRTTEICLELDDLYGDPGKAIPVDDDFEYSGGSVSSPGAHVNCRSSMYLLY